MATRSASDPDLAMMVNRQRITDLLSAYCRHFDRNEPAEVAALFTPDAVVDYGPDRPTTTSARELRESMAQGLQNVFAATSHHVGNIEITFVDDDHARVECAMHAWHRYRDGSPDGWLWGRYLHDVVRTNAGWRIARLQLQAAGTIDFHRAQMHPIGRHSNESDQTEA